MTEALSPGCVTAADRIGSLPRFQGRLVAVPPPPGAGEIRLHRDAHGVPAVFADSLAGAQFGFGFAQAEDHLPELLFLALQARGRLAEAFGAGCLSSDRLMRVLGIGREAEREWATMDAVLKAETLAPFAAGVNAYADRVASHLPGWTRVALPLREADLVAIAGLFGFALSMGNDPQGFAIRALLDPWGERPGTSPSTASNAFALSGARTVSGRPLIGINPHVHLSMPFLLYEARLRGGPLDMRGATFFGLPVFLYGHTARTAWGVTVNYADTFDRYRLITDGKGRIRMDGRWESLDIREERIAVRGAPAEILRVERAPHGVVVQRISPGSAIALDWATREAGADGEGLIAQWHRMNLAATRAAFEQALALRATPNYSYLFIDAAGELLYAHLGRIAERREGLQVADQNPDCGPLVVDWVRDSAEPAIPCAASAAVGRTAGVPGWTRDTLPGRPIVYERFPVLRNPGSGWLQMANTPPWVASRPLPGERWPPGLSECAAPLRIAPCEPRYPYAQNLRGVRYTGALSRPARMDLDAARALLLDHAVPLADYDVRDTPAGRCLDGRAASPDGRCGRLPELFAAWTREATLLSPDHRARLAPAIDLLRAWQGGARRDQRAAALFQDYVFAMGESQGDRDRLAALERAVAFRERVSGRIDPPWGEVHRLVRRPSILRHGGAQQAPVSGTWQFMGALHAFEGPYRPFTAGGGVNAAEDGVVEAGFGTAQIMLVELGVDGPRAWGASVFGASSDPASPHFADQMHELIGQDRLRPLPFDESAVRAGARSSLILAPR